MTRLVQKFHTSLGAQSPHFTLGTEVLHVLCLLLLHDSTLATLRPQSTLATRRLYCGNLQAYGKVRLVPRRFLIFLFLSCFSCVRKSYSAAQRTRVTRLV